MDIGIAFANTGQLGTAEGARALAAACEEHGVESVWAVEHVVVPAGYESEYPYSRSGRMPGGEDSPIPDPLVWLTWVGAHTSRLVLGTGVLILPQRNPVVLAKEVATLDALTGGRVRLGVGVGWLREEFDAIGVPFEQRGARTDEYVAALRELWGAAEPTFHGEYVSFDRALSHPQPPSRRVPIVIGGHTPFAARRAGRLGDGFFPANNADLEELLPIMRAAATSAGRDPDAIEITTGAATDPQRYAELVALGVTRMIVPPPALTVDGIGPAVAQLMDLVRSSI
ncbi:MAG: LLM class F420-dependent oxidoreductase [Microthrixaceae bacterium]